MKKAEDIRREKIKFNQPFVVVLTYSWKSDAARMVSWNHRLFDAALLDPNVSSSNDILLLLTTDSSSRPSARDACSWDEEFMCPKSDNFYLIAQDI